MSQNEHVNKLHMYCSYILHNYCTKSAIDQIIVIRPLNKHARITAMERQKYAFASLLNSFEKLRKIYVRSAKYQRIRNAQTE